MSKLEKAVADFLANTYDGTGVGLGDEVKEAAFREGWRAAHRGNLVLPVEDLAAVITESVRAVLTAHGKGIGPYTAKECAEGKDGGGYVRGVPVVGITAEMGRNAAQALLATMILTMDDDEDE